MSERFGVGLVHSLLHKYLLIINLHSVRHQDIKRDVLNNCCAKYYTILNIKRRGGKLRQRGGGGVAVGINI